MTGRKECGGERGRYDLRQRSIDTLGHPCHTSAIVHQTRADSCAHMSILIHYLKLHDLHLSFIGSWEWTSVVFQLYDTLRRFSCHIMNCVLVAEPVWAFHCVVHMPSPVVLVHARSRVVSTQAKYGCGEVWSGAYFPSAAFMPPCAATVWLLVGNNFDMHAVLKPASARPNAARSPAPPAPTTSASYSWSYEIAWVCSAGQCSQSTYDNGIFVVYEWRGFFCA